MGSAPSKQLEERLKNRSETITGVLQALGIPHDPVNIGYTTTFAQGFGNIGLRWRTSTTVDRGSMIKFDGDEGTYSQYHIYIHTKIFRPTWMVELWSHMDSMQRDECYVTMHCSRTADLTHLLAILHGKITTTPNT